MKKILNIILILIISLTFSGCVPLLFAGTVVGGVYVADEVNEDYNGDFGRYIGDKSEKAYNAITGN